ncbi:hypothetical protein DPMN_048240 [Dreissena polymorpha]|uniref:Uncharacterized protein n=1 Tax=Dreissena polymorpha TaxID=45954 RepID=A0A9D4DAV6_DREPO|nr:hypothetical protein DPMN_048240 [Dreissena polymorpha]
MLKQNKTQFITLIVAIQHNICTQNRIHRLQLLQVKSQIGQCLLAKERREFLWLPKHKVAKEEVERQGGDVLKETRKKGLCFCMSRGQNRRM